MQNCLIPFSTAASFDARGRRGPSCHFSSLHAAHAAQQISSIAALRMKSCSMVLHAENVGVNRNTLLEHVKKEREKTSFSSKPIGASLLSTPSASMLGETSWEKWNSETQIRAQEALEKRAISNDTHYLTPKADEPDTKIDSSQPQDSSLASEFRSLQTTPTAYGYQKWGI